MPLRETLATYLYDSSVPFITLGTAHTFSIIIFLILLFLVPWSARTYLSEKKQHILGSCIGITVAISYLSWPILELLAGTFDIKLHLPFHMCRAANLMIPLVLVLRSYLAYEIVLFWGLTIIHAVITPDITQGYPHYHFSRYWLSHQLMIIALVYATVVYDLRPRMKSVWISFVSLVIFFLMTIPINILLDANYFWICGKPPVHSILDYFGKWPWYILTTAFVALAHFFLFYFIIMFWTRKLEISKRKQ